jgi:SAM-dependent methyltransferase
MATESSEPEHTPFHDADLYDVLFSDLGFDRDFYLGLAREAGGPVLEVACGTGRILLPCLQAGVDIDGLDLFPEMLDVLRRKAAALGLAQGLAPRLHQADMRDFTLPRRYALIIIPFNAFVHNLTTDDQLHALRACRKHLATGGVLVFNVFFPGREIICGPQGSPVLEHEAPHPVTGLPVRIYDTRSLDLVAQVQTSQVEIQELDAEGRVAASHPSTTSMRWTYKPEMELLLQAAGFPRWQICGDFDRRPLTSDTDQMIVFAWKD